MNHRRRHHHHHRHPDVCLIKSGFRNQLLSGDELSAHMASALVRLFFPAFAPRGECWTAPHSFGPSPRGNYFSSPGCPLLLPFFLHLPNTGSFFSTQRARD
ncbi:hypothetical protein M758_7G030800 [Ceratodon purpureus]|nr:hypothetical protein M758_7G030800 [Ceratodon purpureus]